MKDYKYVDYLWDDKKAAELNENQLELFLYRSNLLGADLRITNYGGGNTSCKTLEKDPLTSEEVESLYLAVFLFPYMQGVRFLTDYLQGDTYYKIAYPTHNLVRTKAQFHLFKKLITRKEDLKKIIVDAIQCSI